MILFRKALQAEAAVLCLLAKIDREQLGFDASTSQASSNGSGNGKEDSITVVVQDGVEVRLPMAGQSLNWQAQYLGCNRFWDSFKTDLHALPCYCMHASLYI